MRMTSGRTRFVSCCMSPATSRPAVNNFPAQLCWKLDAEEEFQLIHCRIQRWRTFFPKENTFIERNWVFFVCTVPAVWVVLETRLLLYTDSYTSVQYGIQERVTMWWQR
jgi:hypothetical protein